MGLRFAKLDRLQAGPSTWRGRVEGWLVGIRELLREVVLCRRRLSLL